MPGHFLSPSTSGYVPIECRRLQVTPGQGKQTAGRVSGGKY